MPSKSRACLILLALFVWTTCDASDTEEGGDDDNDDSGGDADGDADTDGGGALFNRCAMDDLLGGFEATVLAEYSGVQGAVADAVLPASIAENKMEAGGCTLWKPPILICDPPCSSQEACDFDGTCIPAPLNQDVGTVTIDGLNKEIAMEPRPPGNNYFDAEVPHPVFDPDARKIELTTTEGFVDAIALEGAGSTPIATGTDNWVITPGEDFPVTWNAPRADSRTKVLLSLSVDQHGTSPAYLECVFDDTGEGLLPAAAVDGLIEAGVSGFPSGRLTRTTVDSVQVAAGCVEFAVESHQAVEVTISGYIPCNTTEDCPDGMICDPVSFLCVEE